MCVSDCKVDVYFFFFKQKTSYEMRISDWSSDVCSSDLHVLHFALYGFDRGRAALLENRQHGLQVGAGRERLAQLADDQRAVRSLGQIDCTHEDRKSVE